MCWVAPSEPFSGASGIEAGSGGHKADILVWHDIDAGLTCWCLLTIVPLHPFIICGYCLGSAVSGDVW